MKLIEQLGGYKKSKKELQLKEEGSIFQCCTAITADMIRNALLEYRRAHNIFEVGDYALPKKEYRIGGRVGIVEKIIDGSVWIVFDSASKMLTPLYTIQHPTDAEITAGHRL